MNSPQPAKAVLAMQRRTIRWLAQSVDPPVSEYYAGRVLNGFVEPSRRFKEQSAALLGHAEEELFRPTNTVTAAERVTASRRALGLPERVEDPSALQQVAVLLEGRQP